MKLTFCLHANSHRDGQPSARCHAHLGSFPGVAVLDLIPIDEDGLEENAHHVFGDAAFYRALAQAAEDCAEICESGKCRPRSES